MGEIVFGVALVLFVAVLIASTYYHDRQKSDNRKKMLREAFGVISDEERGGEKFNKSPALFDHLKELYPDDFCIDKITENDLGLKDVFVRMNRCVSNPGEDYLFSRMHMLSSDRENARLLDKKIEHYTKDPDKAGDILCILDCIRKRTDTDAFLLIKKMAQVGDHSCLPDIVELLLLVISIILIAFYPIPGIIATLIMIAVCIGGYFKEKRVLDDALYGLSYSLKLIRCAHLLSKECNEFAGYEHLQSLQRLSFLISFKDSTTSDPLSIVSDYIRMIAHTDLIALKVKLSKIRTHYDDLAALYVDIGILDACLSIASFASGKKHCTAVLCDDIKIEAKGVYHPLVDNAVCNDISAKRGVLLTGSNASGKSTFLKALGINTLMAGSFGLAFADSFSSGILKLYSSMALSDNLLGKESYYVVEAKSLKRICDAKEGILCIIDEVLRGTNTVERIAASYRILSYLSTPGTICLAATHDLELTYLLENEMDLYHFTEEIQDENVVFPYVLKEGRSNKTNAIKLLAVLGFEDSITDSAIECVRQYNKSGNWNRI